jgi:hypothetical protein
MKDEKSDVEEAQEEPRGVRSWLHRCYHSSGTDHLGDLFCYIGFSPGENDTYNKKNHVDTI